MSNNIYNDEKNLKNLIDDLKNLPKINVPDNFEYNLMTQIQNQNFGDKKEQKRRFSILTFLAPSAVVVTAIVLFFLFLPQNGIDQNPLFTDQKVIDSQALATNTTETASKIAEKAIYGSLSNETKSASNKTNLNAGTSGQSSAPVPHVPNSRSLSLDDFISGQGVKPNSNIRSNVVKSGEDPAEFDGFFIREKLDQKTLEKYRSRLDSIKKAQAKEDSLKKNIR